MAELDGVATVKLIKQDYPDIKVIMLTTFNDAGIRDGSPGQWGQRLFIF
jgi:DNA-binding NarL/FixJ family response regulator